MPSDDDRELREQLDRLPDLFESYDPHVLLFRTKDGDPVIANVDGEYRFLSSKLIYARRAGAETIEAFAGDDEPELVPFREVSSRFHKSSFDDLHPEVTDDD